MSTTETIKNALELLERFHTAFLNHNHMYTRKEFPMSSINRRVDRLPFDSNSLLPYEAQRNYNNLPPLLQEQVNEEYSLNIQTNNRDEYVKALNQAKADVFKRRDEAFEGGY